MLLITSDRGLCGGYNANAIRTCEQLISRLREDNKQVVLYVVGRKGVTYYRFRNRPIEASWTGFSEQPQFVNAHEIGASLIAAFQAGADDADPGRAARRRRRDGRGRAARGAHAVPLADDPDAGGEPARADGGGGDGDRRAGLPPEYEFEPDAEALLDALLPKYINTRIYAALIDAAASESAARRRAMKAATDNAEELIQTYTRQMNSARQAAITQEISEIVGGANALAAAGSEV